VAILNIASCPKSIGTSPNTTLCHRNMKSIILELWCGMWSAADVETF
jgi:hypothetical protein